MKQYINICIAVFAFAIIAGCSGGWRNIYKDSLEEFYKGNVYDAMDKAQHAHYIAVSKGGDYIKTGMLLSYIYSSIDRLQDSMFILKDLLSLKRGRNSSIIHHTLAKCYFSIFDYNRAIKNSKKAGCSGNNDYLCMEDLEIEKYNYCGKYEKAITELMTMMKSAKYKEERKNNILLDYDNYSLLTSLLGKVGKYKESQKYINYIDDEITRKYGKNNILYARMLYRQAYLYLSENKINDAKEKCMKSREIYTKYTDIEDGYMLMCDYIINVANNRNETRENTRYYIDNIIKYYRNNYKRDNLIVANMLMEEGKIDYNKNNNKKAIRLLKKAIEIFEKIHQKRDVGYGIAKGNLGTIMMQSDMAEAIEYLKESKNIIKDSLGVDNEYYLDKLIKLAWCYAYIGKYDMASKTVISIEQSKYYKKKDEKTKITICEIKCYMYTLSEKIGRAEKYCKETLDRKEKLYGKNHYEVARAMGGMAVVEVKKENIIKAERYFKESIRILKMYEKEKRELLIDAMKKLAFLYRSYGKIGNAEEIERQVEMEEKEERKNGQ